MNGWLAFWTGLLVVGLFAYACLAVAVSVGGLLDFAKCSMRSTSSTAWRRRARRIAIERRLEPTGYAREA